jgi:DNA repair exonuclease SbcCD ATPase subunit
VNPSLHNRVDLIRRSAQRIVWLHALGWMVATAVAAAILAASFDYLLRPIDLVLRTLLTLSVLAAAAWAVKRWLWPAWRFRPSLLETAQRIELRWPQLGGRLSSSIEFLSQSDDERVAGSAALRRRTIAEAEAVSSGLDFGDSLNATPQRYGFAASGAVVLLLVILAVVNSQNVAIAAARLAMPWSSLAWPRWNHLQFAEPPRRLARGQDLELAVVDDQGRLPEAVTLQVQFDDGESLEQDMTFLDGRMVRRLENVGQGFRYRAHGGDDDTMPWQRLDVVEPLQLADLKVVIHPPAYAGTAWEATGGVFTTLEGSRLAVAGRADQPLSSASVLREGGKESVELAIGDDGASFSLSASASQPWQPKKSGRYLLQLTSAEGVTTEEAFQWEVRLTPDTPPTVAVESPADGAFATPSALLPVIGTAKDDLALAAINLRFLRPGLSDAQAESIELWKPTSGVGFQPAPAKKKIAAVTGGQSQPFRGEWDLQKIFGIQSGDVLTWFVEASDFRPQTGQTAAARLTIISPEEMQQRLVQRQASALSQLAEALNLERETRTQVGTLEVQWSEVGQWRPRDRDLLHSAELHQRQVQSLVGRTSTGAATILANILADLSANRLELPEMADRCTEILAALDRLEAERFPAAAASFADLLRETRQENSKNGDTKASLIALGKQQEQIAETLESLLGKLTEWDTFQRIRRDLVQIRDDQKTLAVSTQKLQAEVLTSDANPQQHADGRQLGRQQSELVRRFEKLQQRLGEFAQRPETEQAAAQKAATVTELAGKLAIGAKMREAARADDDLKLGQSLQSQEEIDKALAELLDALAGRLDGDNERALQQLKDLAASLDTLQREQGKLADELEKQAAKPDDPKLPKLEDQQRKLEQKADDLAKKLEKNRASEASQAAQNAAGSMNKAAAAAGQKKPGDAADQARDAQKKLQEAKRNVNEQIAQRQADLLREQMARLEQHINGLLVRQEAVKREAERLLGLKSKQKNQLTEAQGKSVGDLAIEQEALAIDSRTLGQGPQLPAAFALQLDWTATDMISAANRLRELQLDDATIASQASALSRLRMILDALQAASSAANKPNESPMGDQPPMPPPPADDAPPPDIHDLAEVKLLRAMQAEINRRTAELETLRKTDGSLPPAAENQLTNLATEQGRVAELALKLVQSLGKPKRPKTDNPDSPPEVSDEELLKKLDEALLPK